MAENGYELASRVLAQSDFSADPLITLSGGHETEWLEFKAALFPVPESALPPGRASRKAQENDWDYFWNVAKAVIAMANGHGGAVLLGVADDATSVPLAWSDPKSQLQSSLDEYVRQTLDRALFPENRRWPTGTQGVWGIDRLPTMQVETRAVTLRSEQVLAILVKPLAADAKPLKCVEYAHGNEHRSVVLCRQPGQLGRVRELIDHEQILDFAQTRRQINPLFGGLWQQFADGRTAQPASKMQQTLAELDQIKQELKQELNRLRARETGNDKQRNRQRKAIQAEPVAQPMPFDAEFVRQHKLFADSDTFIDPAARAFFVPVLVPLLQATGTMLLVSERTVDFLNNAVVSGEDEVAAAARGGLDILNQLQQLGLVADCKDPYPIGGHRFATDLLYRELFVKYQLQMPLCLLTQNAILARQILANAQSEAFERVQPVAVMCLDLRGMPQVWAAPPPKRSANDGEVRRPDLEAQIARDYRILVDTSSLMLSSEDGSQPVGAMFFRERLLPLLIDHRNTLLVPMQVTEEIHKHLRSGNGRRASHAQHAEDILQHCLSLGLLDVGSEVNETRVGAGFADQALVRIAIRFSVERHLCFITQDRELARTLLANRAAGPHKLLVVYISPHSGRLGDWERRLARETNLPDDKSSERHRPPVPPAVPTPEQSVPASVAVSASAIPQAKILDTGVQASRPRLPREISAPKPFALTNAPLAVDHSPLMIAAIPGSGAMVYAGDYGTIRLGEAIAAGGEGTVYATDREGIVCKIYHAECLNPARLNKLTLMLSRRIQIAGVCWPLATATVADGSVVGYLMPRAQGKLLKTSIFAKPLLSNYFPQWTRVQLTRLAITILRAIEQLHALNIFIGDINPQNILVVDEKRIYIVDTDSFQIEGYTCPVGTDTFTPPERQGKNFATFLRTQDDELFAVATLLFMLLFPGKAPYSSQGGGDASENIRNRVFPYVAQEDQARNIKPVGPWQFIWSHLHPRLKDDFVRVFHKGERVAVAELIRHLRFSLKDLEEGRRSVELFPKQPRLREGETVTATCELCGRDDEISESLAQRLEEGGSRFRHAECSALKRLERMENTRMIKCALCGEEKVAATEHLEKIAAKNQDYWCQDCSRAKREGRVRRQQGRNRAVESSQSGRWVIIAIALIIFFMILKK